MGTSRSPAFQFYPRDFITDENVVRMDATEIGIYIQLLCYCWLEGSISSDLDLLAKMVRVPSKQMARAWTRVGPCFQAHPEKPNRLVQNRLERERTRQAERREKAAEAGRLGGLAKGSNGKAEGKRLLGEGYENAVANPSSVAIANSSPTSTTTATTAVTPQPPDGGEGEDRSQKSPAFEFGHWFFDTGMAVGAIEQHLKIPGALEFAYRHLTASKHLIAAYPLPEIKRRAQILFERKVRDGPDHFRKPANPTTLRDHWTLFDPPRRPEGAEDYDKLLGLDRYDDRGHRKAL